MWYIIQVYSGREEESKVLLGKYIDQQVVDDCKIPQYVCLRKREGSWQEEIKISFPGYLFVKTKKVERLYLELKKVPKMTKLLGIGKEIIPITREEQEFLFRIGGKNLVVEFSTGKIKNGVIQIEKGPVKGMEEYITRIDRHKRMAWMTVPLSGQMTRMKVGLEIVE